MHYAIAITVLLALASLVGAWIKGPNWPQTRVIGLFSTLLVAVVVLMYVQMSSHPNSTPSPPTPPTQITSSDEEPATEIPYAEGRTIHSTELQVGDCFNFNNNDSSTQVGDVEVVDCSAPHLYEVYSNYQIPQSTFPDENTMKSEQYTACHDTFETYVGVPYDQSQYGATTLTPTENSWAQGDHAITCFLMSKDGSQLTGSLKGAAK